MPDLRSELETYAATDEPPMRLTFDTVMTSARRTHSRRRSTAIATGVAAVAAVAIAIPTLLAAPNSPPADAASALAADCKAESDQLRKVACVVRREATLALPSPLRVESPELREEGTTHGIYATNSWISDGSKKIGEITVGTSQREDSWKPCDDPKFCELRKGPRGETIRVERYPSDWRQQGVQAHKDGVTAFVATKTDSPSPLSVDALIKIVTTPELLP